MAGRGAFARISTTGAPLTVVAQATKKSERVASRVKLEEDPRDSECEWVLVLEKNNMVADSFTLMVVKGCNKGSRRRRRAG